MTKGPEIVEKWIERIAESDPEQAPLRTLEPDPFRNPVGYTIRKSLAQLWEQLQHDMDAAAIDAALDAMIRIRAVQDISPSQAIGFVTPLRSILREHPDTFDLVLLESRIDQIALAASDKYAECRQQMIVARLHETERLTRARWAAGKASA